MRTTYCMTCDEQVHETPTGTCPAGHPLSSSEDTGPEPWVGFAASAAGAAATSRPAERAADSSPAPQFRAVDVTGLQEAPVSHGLNGNGNGHAPEVAPPAPPPAPEPQREPAVGDASDELASMLADAFDRVEPPTEDAPGPAAVDDEIPNLPDLPDVPAPADVSEPSAPPTDASDAPPARDWDDLATLAAELELEDRSGPAEPEPRDVPAAEVADAPAVPAEEPPTAPPPPAAPPLSQAPPPTGPPLSQAPPTDEAPPMELPAADAPPLPPLDPVAPLDADVDPLWDHVDAPAVPSAAEAPELEPSQPTPTVDLGNFTARGTPVRGGSDAGRRSQKKKSRRKR